MKQVRQEVLEQIKESPKAIGRLSYEFAKHTNTIKKWLEENNIMLTTPQAVNAMAEELNIPESEILTAA